MVQISKIYGFKEVVKLDKVKNKEAIIFGIYTSALMIQNILALKSIDIWIFTMTTGVLVSPIVFMAQDVETEIFGFKQARKMILLAYIMNFIFTLLVSLSIIITPSIAYNNQEAFATIFSTTIRITVASFFAYCVGSLTNAKIMSLKKEEHGLFFRAISSTIVGQLLDNAIFSFGAFLGILPTKALIMMVVGATIWETIYEIIFYPITRNIILKLKANNNVE